MNGRDARGDGVGAMRVSPRPLYRSRLLWLGVPGLVFLLWVWVDSLRNFSVVGSDLSLKGRLFQMQAFQPEVCVQRGYVFYHRSRVTESSPDIVVSKAPLGFRRQKTLAVSMKSKEEGRWGFKVIERELPVTPSRLRVKAVECWFPVWFVVAGYAVGWLGTLVIYRRWLRRRWEASRVVKEECLDRDG